MQNFRIVTLDYPKKILGLDAAREAFIGMIQSKQANFERASENYVTLDPLDMISTHILIYDTSPLFKPKPILAIRVCYENRVKKHALSLPIENYYRALPPEGIDRFLSFRKKRSVLVDCNAWFVDADYTYSKTKVPLSDIGFFFVALFILRKKQDHLVGCSNEQFKASRWVNNIGNLIEPVTFIHPKMPTVHQLVLLDGFSGKWLLDCFRKYSNLVENAYELLPDTQSIGEELLSVDDVYAKLLGESKTLLRVA